jgi:tetratricopeptide (TPR) repeat protein
MNDVRTSHADPQTLAAFAEGRLDAAAREALLGHLDVCADCTHDASLAMKAAGEEAPAKPLFRGKWLLAVAAVIALAVALPLLRKVLRPSPMEALAAAMPRSARAIEPRLGGLAWAEYGGPERAEGGAVDAERLKLAGAAGEVIQRAETDASPEAQHAAAIALTVIDRPLEAIAKLEAVAKTKKDARTWSDLAAARYAAAVSHGRASLLPEALAAADEALQIDARFVEGLFNRALVLERMGLTAEARRAWQSYLAVDAASPWANEARAHLARLPQGTRSSEFTREQALLESAAAAGEAARVRELVARYPQQARTFAEAEYLGRWAEGGESADRWLRVARSIGAALVATSGESLLHDAVAAIDSASSSGRATLVAAHLAYRRGRIAYSKHEPAVAERELRTAADRFAAARSPMALMARYYAASVRLAQNDAATARRELEPLLADAGARYVACGAHVRWELARARMYDDDWSGAAAVLEQGAERFRRLGERANESFVESMLASCLVSMGRFDDAWNARARVFRALSAEGHSDMLATSVTAAVKDALQAGRNDAALALTRIELEDVRPVLATKLLIQRAMLETIGGGSAAGTIDRAESLAGSLPDGALRARTLADVAVARGAAERDPAQSIEALTNAIAFYRAHNVIEALPEGLLLRSRALVKRGDAAAALRDLEEGMAALVRHRGQAFGRGVLHAEEALFIDGVRIALDGGDAAAAFAYAERARGESITVAELQKRLAGTATVVLELVALPSEAVTFAISGKEFVVARRANHLPLYERVIAPVAATLNDVRRVIIVPDRSLEHVPFAALHDGRQYLVERFEVAVAASAASLQARGAEPVRSAMAMALPSGEGTQSTRLPDSDAELAEVGAVYSHCAREPRATLAQLREVRADVLHLAGHTAREQGAGEQALLFADGRASWKTIAAMAPLRPRVVVLAACETLRRPDASATRALTLAGAFAAAGARDVVGTLTPIGDRHARVLFAAFHRHLAAGATPAAALRAAQLEELTRGGEAWKAVALLTTSV